MENVKIDDVLRYIQLFKATYPNAYANKTEDEKRLMITAWYQCLKDYPREILDRAVMDCIRVCRFAPVIADVVSFVEKYIKGNRQTATEAWAELSAAAIRADKWSRDLHFTFVDPVQGITQGEIARREIKKIWDNLSDPIRTYVGSVNELLDLGGQENFAFEKGRFLREYENVCETVRIRNVLLPADDILKRIE